MIQFRCCCNYATVGHIGMQAFNFVVLSVVIAPHIVLNPQISKTHLSIVSLNVRKIEFMLKRTVSANSPR